MSRPGPRKVMEGLGGESQGPPQAAKASRQAYDKNATYRRFPFHLGQVGGPGGGHFLCKKRGFLKISMSFGLSRSRRLPRGILAQVGPGLDPLAPPLGGIWGVGVFMENL